MADLQQIITANLAQGKDVLDIRKRLSYGRGTGTQNLIDEHAKAIQLSWTITNTTVTMKTIALSSFFDTLKNTTQFGTVAELLTEIKADAAILDGDVITVDADHKVIATSTDAERPLEAFLRYFASNPTRLVGMALRSSNATTGAPESSNYDLKMRSYYVSPFDVPKMEELNLAPLVPAGTNFNTDRLNVNFIIQNFQALLSNENFLTMQINPNTKLSITLYVGAQKSNAQSFYRDIKQADDILRPELIRVAR
jgi:hypothetical protein